MKPARGYRVGRDLIPVGITGDTGCLEGRLRLRPGQVIALADVPSPHGLVDRRARVESWAVARLGQDGPVYRGVCRWIEPPG